MEHLSILVPTGCPTKSGYFRGCKGHRFRLNRQVPLAEATSKVPTTPTSVPPPLTADVSPSLSVGRPLTKTSHILLSSAIVQVGTGCSPAASRNPVVVCPAPNMLGLACQTETGGSRLLRLCVVGHRLRP